MPSIARARHHVRERRRAWHRNDARALIVLVIFIAGALIVGGVYSHIETLRRTGQAGVTIDARLLQPGKVYPDTPLGHYLRYSYVVRDVRYEGATFRRWTDVERYQPKVCYDPNVPSDHLLVAGLYRCGG